MRCTDPLMDYADLNKRIKRLTAELELINSFEQMHSEDDGPDYRVAKRARKLRRAEIETELGYLHEQRHDQ